MSNGTILDSVYQDMITANKRAEAASFKYRQLSSEIDKSEQEAGEKLGLSFSDIQERIRARKEKDNELIGYFKVYAFNQGEVLRLSAILQGIAAYKSLKPYSALAQGPSVPINISGQ